MARTVVTPELIQKMNELYLKIGTYSGVSRELGGTPSPTTVKKYIIPNYVSAVVVEQNKVTFKTEDLPEFTEECLQQFAIDNWGDLCNLTNDEKEEIEKLWQELVI